MTLVIINDNCGGDLTKQCLLKDTNGLDPSGFSIQDTNLGGQPAYLVSVKDFSKMPYGYNGSDKTAITVYKDKIYRIYLGLNKTTQVSPWSEKEYNIFNNILSAFKFTDQNSITSPSASEINSFPIYPNATFLGKEEQVRL